MTKLTLFDVAKLKYIAVLLQVNVYSLHFSLMQFLLWLIKRQAKAKLGLVYKRAQHKGWLLRADNMLFSSEIRSKRAICFMLRGDGDMETS